MKSSEATRGARVVWVLILLTVAHTSVTKQVIGAIEPPPHLNPDSLHSDFNGDGYADMAVGAPFEDVGGVRRAGSVNVLYGSSAGLQVAAPADQFWTQDSPGVEDEAENYDRLGSILSAADFNGDGFADLAVGVEGENVGSVPQAGAVQVLYGSASGLQATSPDDQVWTQDSPGVDDVVEIGDSFGTTLATGDLNGDGFSDLAVASVFEDVGNVVDAGSVNVLYGSPAGLQAMAPRDQFVTQDSPGVKERSDTDDRFGSSLGIGDFNGDGFGDLAVGALYEDVGSVVDAGSVNVVYGSALGLQITSPPSQLLTQDAPSVQDSAETGDVFGMSAATGDWNADGFADLVVGAYLEDVGSLVDAGSANVLYGSAQGLQATSPDDQFWTQDSPGVEDVAETGDRFGWSLSSGDLNGDGFPDLAIQAGFEDIGAAFNAGADHVLYGSADGLQTSLPEDQFWTQDSPDVEDVSETGDLFGDSIAIGDFNGDGYGDVASGSGEEDLGTLANAGCVNVLYGSQGGLQAISPPDQFWTQDSPGVEDQAEEEDILGDMVAAR